MKVLFDTNIILDIALKRLPHFDHAVKLFDLIDEQKISAYITATTISDIYYISRKEKGHELALQFLKNLVEILDIVGVDKEIIIKSLYSNLKDFEDAIQVTAAEYSSISCIITRNKKDFQDSNLEINTPLEFIQSL